MFWITFGGFSLIGISSKVDRQKHRKDCVKAKSVEDMSPSAGISSSQPPLNFQHPYLDSRVKRPQKRELGLFDLFVFKMFGCFTPDDLPPPNPDATIYQAGGKSSSSSVTLASTGTTATNPTSAPPLPPLPTSTGTTTPFTTPNTSGGVTGTIHNGANINNDVAGHIGSSDVAGGGSTGGSDHGSNAGVSTGCNGNGNSVGNGGGNPSGNPVNSSSASSSGLNVSLGLVSGKRRMSRAGTRGSHSAWPVKVPEAPRIAMERTQFVEQRVEQKKREAKRKLEEERAKAAAEAAQSSAAIAKSTCSTREKLFQKSTSPTSSTSSPKQNPLKSIIDNDVQESAFPFNRINQTSSRDLSIDHGVANPKVDDSIQSASVAGRVSRLSAMFEQQ